MHKSNIPHRVRYFGDQLDLFIFCPPPPSQTNNAIYQTYLSLLLSPRKISSRKSFKIPAYLVIGLLLETLWS